MSDSMKATAQSISEKLTRLGDYEQGLVLGLMEGRVSGAED